ncbi:uncharacterized protein N7446_003936 [Penicillium canescens]|uniref:C2H2-type domain-containing protein n=1 Tax=Penicillium canescens TaxID=5083 RepID=A0AAD6I1Z7_PENCN|nr:uncharacterized protein N7446_003936 [Penicillium canescens]KAJ6027471.1 hypothetical protein N7460_012288 [Penicillium canescens]KAJ6040746.1 hypothetical protein N7444_009651 [Penicillium canescens]KAJ6066899.1 hypothetical protein N7446_003936 [Penicillium canescens]
MRSGTRPATIAFDEVAMAVPTNASAAEPTLVAASHNSRIPGKTLTTALLGPLCQTICIRNLSPLDSQFTAPAPVENPNTNTALAKGNLCQLPIDMSYPFTNFHAPFAVTSGAADYSQPMHTFGYEPQPTVRLSNKNLPDRTVPSAWSPAIPLPVLPEASTVVCQSQRDNFDHHFLHQPSDSRGHGSIHSNIGINSQLPSKDIALIRQSKEKRQTANVCWEGDCKGRVYSNFSNLLRHQRERHGESDKVSCTLCGSKFTRTTARNVHERNEVCSRSK